MHSKSELVIAVHEKGPNLKWANIAMYYQYVDRGVRISFSWGV